MLTYFRGDYGTYGRPRGGGYTLNEYFTYHLDLEHVLLTTRDRAWVILSPQEYELFLRRRIEDNPRLYVLLEDLGLVLTARNTPSIAALHCRRFSFLHRPPSLFIMVPTVRCNMACLYCHANAKVSANRDWDMSEIVLHKTIDFFFSVPRRSGHGICIEFQGGEPLLRYDLVQQAMDYAEEQARAAGTTVKFRMVTNLTLMDDEIAHDITQRGNIELCSSLDGPAAVHDKQRVFPNGRGTYRDVIRARNELGQKHSLPVSFIPTETALSVTCNSQQRIREFATSLSSTTQEGPANERPEHDGPAGSESPGVEVVVNDEDKHVEVIIRSGAYLLPEILQACYELRDICACFVRQRHGGEVLIVLEPMSEGAELTMLGGLFLKWVRVARGGSQ